MKALRVDSGGHLSGVLLRSGLVDEVSVLVDPCVVGGESPASIFRAADLESADGITPLKLAQLRETAGRHRVAALRGSPVGLSPVRGMQGSRPVRPSAQPGQAKGRPHQLLLSLGPAPCHRRLRRKHKTRSRLRVPDKPVRTFSLPDSTVGSGVSPDLRLSPLATLQAGPKPTTRRGWPDASGAGPTSGSRAQPS